MINEYLSLSLSTHMLGTQNMDIGVHIGMCIDMYINLLGRWKGNKKWVSHKGFLYKLYVHSKYISTKCIQNKLKCVSLNANSTTAAIKFYCKYWLIVSGRFSMYLALC